MSTARMMPVQHGRVAHAAEVAENAGADIGSLALSANCASAHDLIYCMSQYLCTLSRYLPARRVRPRHVTLTHERDRAGAATAAPSARIASGVPPDMPPTWLVVLSWAALAVGFTSAA